MVSSKRVLCVLLSSSFNPFLLTLLIKCLQAFIHHHMTDRSDDFLCSHEFFVNFNFAKRHLWENKVLVMVSRESFAANGRFPDFLVSFAQSLLWMDNGQWNIIFVTAESFLMNSPRRVYGWKSRQSWPRTYYSATFSINSSRAQKRSWMHGAIADSKLRNGN